jgi:hypothetical protein
MHLTDWTTDETLKDLLRPITPNAADIVCGDWDTVSRCFSIGGPSSSSTCSAGYATSTRVLVATSLRPCMVCVHGTETKRLAVRPVSWFRAEGRECCPDMGIKDA